MKRQICKAAKPQNNTLVNLKDLDPSARLTPTGAWSKTNEEGENYSGLVCKAKDTAGNSLKVVFDVNQALNDVGAAGLTSKGFDVEDNGDGTFKVTAPEIITGIGMVKGRYYLPEAA